MGYSRHPTGQSIRPSGVLNSPSGAAEKPSGLFFHATGQREHSPVGCFADALGCSCSCPSGVRRPRRARGLPAPRAAMRPLRRRPGRRPRRLSSPTPTGSCADCSGRGASCRFPRSATRRPRWVDSAVSPGPSSRCATPSPPTSPWPPADEPCSLAQQYVDMLALQGDITRAKTLDATTVYHWRRPARRHSNTCARTRAVCAGSRLGASSASSGTLRVGPLAVELVLVKTVVRRALPLRAE